MPFSIPSFAKVNLHLRVLGRREDGFHDIFTVFQTVSLHDILTFDAAPSGVSLTCDDEAVPTDGTNLIIKAAEILRARYGIAAGASIQLQKRIPMGGGLGGGSSNAAAALIGLARLWSLNLSDGELIKAAGEVGSDVPFFLIGGTAIGTGRGTQIEPIDDLRGGEHLLIVTPDVHVSTARAYERLRAQNLTNEEANRILRVCRSEADTRDFLGSTLINDFEATVFADFPEIGKAKQTLIALGAERALMSGSGASVFGIFDKDETRQAALKALDNEVNWRKFAVAAISREQYREALEIAY